MADRRTVYAVTVHNYPAYSIEGMFADRAKAEALQKKLEVEIKEGDDINTWNTDVRLHAFEIDLDYDLPAKLLDGFRVVLKKDGDDGAVETVPDWLVYAENRPVVTMYWWSDKSKMFDRIQFENSAYQTEMMTVFVFARDKEHALEIARLWRDDVIEQGLWPRETRGSELYSIPLVWRT